MSDDLSQLEGASHIGSQLADIRAVLAKVCSELQASVTFPDDTEVFANPTNKEHDQRVIKRDKKSADILGILTVDLLDYSR